jgi:predicted O-methyltransferase YrrM
MSPLLPLPPLVQRAVTLATTHGFPHSCSPQVGQLLCVLAASGNGTAAESGTGYGVGTAWIRTGLPADSRVVTVEHDADRAAAAASLFADDPQVVVVAGDWHRLADFAPFYLLFCDGGGKRDDQELVIDLLQPGGLVVLDDFTVSSTWPPIFAGRRDRLREYWLTHPRLLATEVLTTAASTAIIGVKRP